MEKMEIVQSSEEVNQINTALSHCTQLKTHLTGALLHIQRLNAKYNEVDYMSVIRNFESYRSSSSATSTPYNRKKRPGTVDCSMDDISQQSTPVKSNKKANIRRRIVQLKNESQFDNSTLSNTTDDDDESTPKRSMRELKRNNNTITVRTIKVQRNIEAILTHLQVMQKMQQRSQRHHLEQSLYQNCCNTSTGSPGHLGHKNCLDHSFNSMNSSSCMDHSSINNSPVTPVKRWTVRDQQQHALRKVQRFYATPLERMHKRLINLNASLIRTC